MDFTIKRYRDLLECLKTARYSFQTFEQYLINPAEKVIILRHDVDLQARNSLITAQIEHEFGIQGSYYFRIVKESNNPSIISKIVKFGHEIGYHYETMDSVSRKQQVTGDKLLDIAYEEFYKNLEYFRTFYPIKTICMHGSPLSKYDNKDIWKKYDYKSLGLTGEPYLDIDFSKVFYLTDTGRRWDGDKVSVRDKMQTSDIRHQTKDEKTNRGQRTTSNQLFRHTKDIINAAEKGILPNQIMITVHPQRWNDSIVSWTKELFMQNLKNIVKRALIQVRK